MKKLGSGVFSHVYDWNSHAVAKFTQCSASAFWLHKLIRARRVSRFFPSVLFTPDQSLFIVERLYRTPSQVVAAQQARRNRGAYANKKPAYSQARLHPAQLRRIDRNYFKVLGEINAPSNLTLYCSIPGAQPALAQLCLWAEEYDATHDRVMRVDLHADNVMLDMFGHMVFSDPVVTRVKGEFDEHETPSACMYTRVETLPDGSFQLWPAALPLRTASARKTALHFEKAGIASLAQVNSEFWKHLATRKARNVSHVRPALLSASTELHAEHTFALERFATT